MKSFSKEIWRSSRCVAHGWAQGLFRAKVIFIELKNFEEIKSTETFEAITNVVTFQNLIIIQPLERDERMLIYDINSLEIIQNKEFVEQFGVFFNFDNKFLVSIPKDRYYGNVITYELEDNKLIKHYEIKSKMFEKLDYEDYRRILGYDRNFLILKDKRIIISTFEERSFEKIIILISFNHD